MNERILVVDDDPMNLRNASMVLRNKYKNIYCAKSGQECLDAIKKQRYDLILMDLNMPGMSGFETISRIHHDRLNRNSKIICFTASAARTDVLAAMELNVNDYIIKPFLPEVLLEKVSAVLEG